jgi:hypothetical protein
MPHWEISPYPDLREADYRVMPAETDADHHAALDYAKERLESLWDGADLDETITVQDGDVVLVPEGYHPVGAAHGYDLYYLNVMAGPKRLWRFHNDPAHAWMLKK